MFFWERLCFMKEHCVHSAADSKMNRKRYTRNMQNEYAFIWERFGGKIVRGLSSSRSRQSGLDTWYRQLCALVQITSAKSIPFSEYLLSFFGIRIARIFQKVRILDGQQKKQWIKSIYVCWSDSFGLLRSNKTIHHRAQTCSRVWLGRWASVISSPYLWLAWFLISPYVLQSWSATVVRL